MTVAIGFYKLSFFFFPEKKQLEDEKKFEEAVTAAGTVPSPGIEYFLGIT